MSEIIDKTYKLIDTLDKSKLIYNLTKYRDRLMKNNDILQEIVDIRNETNSSILINKRKEIYKNNDYKMYMKYYNELFLIVLKINHKYREYTNTKDDNYESRI